MSKGQELLGMSDEDFLKMPLPVEEEEAKTEEIVAPAPEPAAAVVAPQIEADPASAGETAVVEPAAVDPVPSTTKTPVAGEQEAAAASASEASVAADGKPAAQEQHAEPPAAAPTNYEEFYKKVMAPFKANGKMIELQSPEEAVALMQMGANYTRKMQSITPHRKVLMMLENNGLLDEGKLSYLIDIDKKNPEAIKKLIKDAGIDPFEIDVNTEPLYTQGNHTVTDSEANFRTVLDELGSTPEGVATLQEINGGWDQASKEVLWQQPDLMNVMHEQRENGIYDRIVTEVERQRTLGKIPPNATFLQAYKAAGDYLQASGGFADIHAKLQGAQQAQPVATTVAAPKPAVSNGGAATAAAPTRSTPKKAETFVNPLSLSDEDFLKQFQGRSY